MDLRDMYRRRLLLGGDTEWLAYALTRIGLTLGDPFAD